MKAVPGASGLSALVMRTVVSAISVSPAPSALPSTSLSDGAFARRTVISNSVPIGCERTASTTSDVMVTGSPLIAMISSRTSSTPSAGVSP